MTPQYLLGHSEWELERLAVQARLVNPFTRRFLEQAGIGAGMRVLDVGSGAGDTALLLAEIVGPSGAVTGVDRSGAALDAARRRVGERSLTNVRFVESDLVQVAFDEKFDAIAGRYVLMFQPDPVATLRALIRNGRSGSIVLFHEPEWDGARSYPPAPLYDRCCRWIVETVQKAGATEHMGSSLHTTFQAAGLPAPTMDLGANVGGAETASDAIRLITDIVRTIAPEMERLGVATAEEIEIETLEKRTQQEVLNLGGIVIGRLEVGAWCRMP